ncbi:MAG: hypothetical protein WKF83_12500 [Nocardioidaceae bacterium]
MALLAATSLLALVGALAHWQLVTIAALAASVLCEPLVQRYAPTFGRLLGQADLGPTTRAALRGGVVALAGVGLWESRWPAVAFAVVFGAYLLLHCAHAFCVAQLRKAHSRPVLTRNVDTGAGAREVWGIGPHRWRREVPAQLAVVVPAVCVTEGSWVVWVLGTLAVTLQMMLVIGPVADVLASRTARGDGVRKPKMVPIQTFIDDYRPEVVLHLSGSKTSAYQVNVWLPTLERLRQRTLIVLRDDELFHALDATSLPVICAASGSDLMSLDLSHVRVALFPTNIGNNIHILRLPTLMSAFIGHGDSDKSASAIPTRACTTRSGSLARPVPTATAAPPSASPTTPSSASAGLRSPTSRRPRSARRLRYRPCCTPPPGKGGTPDRRTPRCSRSVTGWSNTSCRCPAGCVSSIVRTR